MFQFRLKLTSAFFEDPEFIREGLSPFPEISLRKTKHKRRTKFKGAQSQYFELF